MLVHSRIKSVYLTRRIRLFQAYSNKPNQPRMPDNQQWFSNSSVQNRQEWICKIGQNLENSVIELANIKDIIYSTPNHIIQQTATLIIQMIQLALHFHPSSKISNILYYLCRKSYAFRNQLCSHMRKKNWLNSQNKMPPMQYSKRMRQKMVILLTDIFIFGIYITQNEFMTGILPLVIADQDNQIFQLQYFSHYAMILISPQVLLERHRNKWLQSACQCIKQIVDKRMERTKNQMEDKLQQLQDLYVKLERSSFEVKQKQQEYIDQIRKYEMVRKYLLNSLNSILQSLEATHHAVSPNGQFQQLLAKIESKYRPVIKELQVQNESTKEMDNFKETEKSSDNSSQSSILKQTWSEQKILTSIYDNCKHYKKKNLFKKDIIYTYPFQSSTPVQQVRFKQQLPESFIERLRNCTSIDCSDGLATQFLDEFNKHMNRKKLVSVIFKELYERNNIDYIVRALHGVYKVEKEQISQFIQQELNFLENKNSDYGNTRHNQSQYKKYSNLVIELIKFEIVDEHKYMVGLFQEIKCLSGADIQEEQPTSQVQNESTKQTNQSKINILEVVSLLQRLGRHLYYRCLDAHIIFNKIIKEVYHHIKTRVIGYDIDTINRFNGLVLYLQNIKPDPSSNTLNILPVSDLQDERSFNYTVKKFQKQLKGHSIGQDGMNGIAKVCRILTNSISHQNYISTFLYAELIYKINSKKLDEQIKNITKHNIQDCLQKNNSQGAANWARFLGELHRSKICHQSQLIAFLDEVLVNKFFATHTSATVKVISSAIEACKEYMKKTKKISEISQVLTFLLVLKKQLLRTKGLPNSILELEVAEIMQYFHPAFAHLTTVQQCIDLQIKVVMSSDVEKLMDEYEQQYLDMEQSQTEKLKQKAVNGYYCQEDEKKIKERQDIIKSIAKQKELTKLQAQNFEKQIYELQTNSSIIDKQFVKPSQTGTSQIDPSEKKIKKFKIISRSKNGNRNLQQKQITLI